jgi:hypothetical protein
MDNGYHVQDGCHNCFHRFDHDGLFCNYKSIRPPADFSEEKAKLGVEQLTLQQRLHTTDRWMEWAFWHRVVPAGTCPHHARTP